MTAPSDLRVYATQPHPCSYIEQQQATTIFIDPDINLDVTAYSQLANIGFRRSGPHVYRPHCKACSACVSVRVAVNDFKPNRSQKRVLKRNGDLKASSLSSIADDKYYELYQRYISARHADGDMYPPSREQFDSFLSNEMDVTSYYAFHLGEQLAAVAVTDQMDNGLSAMYTFFEPELEQRSLGRFAILWQIERTRELGLNYLYLGYWIKQCRKMRYKTEYRPTQLLINNRWVTVT